MKQPRTLQEIYEAVQNGTGHKDVFLKEAKRLYSGLITNAATFEQTVHIFKNRGVLNENYIDLKPFDTYEGREQEGWETKFKSFLKEIEEESVKADTTKQSKYVDDVRKNSYDNSDVKNLDNQIGQEVINGIYFEGKENPDKTLDELRSIVSKNLAKDPLYYVKNAMFGIKGVGVSDELPGLKASKTDQMTPVKMKSINEAKENKLEQRLKDIEKAGGLATIEAKIAAVDEEITARTERINMIDENEDLAELVNPVKLREMKKEIKILERNKEKLQKLYERMTGKKKAEVIDEPQEIEKEETGEIAEIYSSQKELQESKYQFRLKTKLNEEQDDYIGDNFERGDKVRFGGQKNYKGIEVIRGTILKADGPYLVIKGEDGKIYHENSNDVELYEDNQPLNENENENDEPELSKEWKLLLKSYGNYMKNISREDMFDSDGNYNPTLKKYHEQIRKFTDSKNKEERTQSRFISSWF